jgi:inhibitor of KinA sporulation pathway (predicted exonuclease)
MTYIIFDLEWVATFAKGQLPEIISIGAVKIENDKLVEADTFQSFVRPRRALRLNKRTIKLTGIKPQDVLTEGDFPTVWKRFIKWISDDEYFLLSWGTEDVRNLIRNCRQYRMPLEWLQNYNDLQAEFGRMHGLQNQSGLMQALEILHLEPVGRHHSAVDDARNTAEVFKAIFKTLRLAKNNHYQIQHKYLPAKKVARRVAQSRATTTRGRTTTTEVRTTKKANDKKPYTTTTKRPARGVRKTGAATGR